MVKLIIAGLVAIVLASKFFDWLVHKEVPSTKEKIYMFLFLIMILIVFAEKIWGISI
ncbi:MAG: hypothetical protein NTW29_14780 [Bacteroidetes bacterium]|nr:hypothetical protein [Bacteroidota bacterium]